MSRINKIDYNCIGDVAQHCDHNKICIAENEALEFDLDKLYCSNMDEILSIWDEVDAYILAKKVCDENPECDTPPEVPENYELKYNLIYGGNYQDCSGKTKSHKGVKRVVIYYSYSRYLTLNLYTDTASGLVVKANEFSLPVDFKQLQMYADKYRNMGLDTFKETIKFLCVSKDTFNWFSSNECKGCGCGSEKCSGTTTKGYGMKVSNISRRL